MARKPLFTLQQSEGGMQSVFNAFYRKGSQSKTQADVQVLFRRGAGLKIGSAPTKKIRQWLLSTKRLETGRTPDTLRLEGWFDYKQAAKEYYNFVMGISEEPPKPEVIEVPKVKIIKETTEVQEVFSDATGFPLKWMKTEVYFIKGSDFCHGTVTGFRTDEDLETINLQIDCSFWIPKQIAYNSLEDFKNMIENKLKKL